MNQSRKIQINYYLAIIVVEPYTEMTGVKPCTKAADVESYTKVIFETDQAP